MVERITEDERKFELTPQELLKMNTADIKSALNKAGNLISAVLQADKVDVFLYDSTVDSLVAIGTSQGALGLKQQQLGLDRLPVSNGGRTVEVYLTGQPHITGHADQDPEMVRGVVEALGVRSKIDVPMEVNGERRGVLTVVSTTPDRFDEADLRFLELVGQWVGSIAHRAELAEQMRQDVIEQNKQGVAEELITVLAHDLGNYLAPLVGRLSLIEHRAKNDARPRDLRDAESAMQVVTRLRRLIADLLDISRLSKGLLHLTVEPTNLVTLVEETIALLQTDNTTIEQAIPLAEVCVDIDANRLRQAVENMLSNALKHSPNGTLVSVEVRTEKREDVLYAMLTVRDQGVGIAPDLLPKVFDRFTSGPQSTGLGLGLYLTQQIVLAHGGELTVSSTVNEGSTFTIALPTTDGEHTTC